MNVHGHETHFRDTAHGLLTWAVSTLVGVVLVATVLAPLEEQAAAAAVADAAYADAAAAPMALNTPADPAAVQAHRLREANLAAQASFFTGMGLLLSAFTASVAAAIGGRQNEAMHARYGAERLRPAS